MAASAPEEVERVLDLIGPSLQENVAVGYETPL